MKDSDIVDLLLDYTFGITPNHTTEIMETAAREIQQLRGLLIKIVEQYDAAPDGPLGKGFTNEPFLKAKEFLKK